jgi:hypothetical protein
MVEPPPLIRVMAIHAVAYCERLFYLEEVEEIRVADERVYAGRTLHETLAESDSEYHSVSLESEAWGLKGRVDYLRYRDGGLVAYEHKRGLSQRATRPGDRTVYKSSHIVLCSASTWEDRGGVALRLRTQDVRHQYRRRPRRSLRCH